MNIVDNKCGILFSSCLSGVLQRVYWFRLVFSVVLFIVYRGSGRAGALGCFRSHRRSPDTSGRFGPLKKRFSLALLSVGICLRQCVQRPQHMVLVCVVGFGKCEGGSLPDGRLLSAWGILGMRKWGLRAVDVVCWVPRGPYQFGHWLLFFK